MVDSGSTDKTVEVAKALGARVVFNPWPGYGKQKNFAQKQATHDWVLNIDADEIVPSELAQELQSVLSHDQANGHTFHAYSFPRKTFYLGRWIKHGGWYPDYKTRLVNRNYGQWTEPSVHETLEFHGEAKVLKSALHHFTFSDIQDQILTNLNFSKLGFIDLRKKGQKASVLKLLGKPLGKFVETYFLKRGFLDGLPGFIISVNAAHSIFLKYAYLIEADLTHEDISHR